MAGFLFYKGKLIETFAADPSFTQVPFPLNSSSVTLRFSGNVNAGEIDLTGAMFVCITPSNNNLKRYFNSDTTKTVTVFGAQENIIPIGQNVSSITLVGTDSSIEIQAM